jgi:uncharacterized protein YrrD
VLDDGGRHVLRVTVERGWLRRYRQFIALPRLQAIRRDRVVATSHGPEATPPPPANGSLTGTVAVSRIGRYLGVVDDIDFDERTGEISAYEIVQPERPSGQGRRRLIPAGACPDIADVMIVRDRSA